MHSRIFQLSTENLPQDEWINYDSISDLDMGRYFIDYCVRTDYYEDDLKRLAEILPKRVFKVEGRKIEIVSDGSCLFEQYKKDLLWMVSEMQFDSGDFQFLGFAPYAIADRARRIINTDFLFYMEDWSGGVGTTETLISYAFNAMNDERYPKTLYINGILNYHI